MGCAGSSPAKGDARGLEATARVVRAQPWVDPDGPMTMAELEAKREMFWETQPMYGGERVVWDQIQGACALYLDPDADLELIETILESAGIQVASPNSFTSFYDERGFRYAIPMYCVTIPTNVKRA